MISMRSALAHCALAFAALALLSSGASAARRLQQTFGNVPGNSELLPVGLVDMPGYDFKSRMCKVTPSFCSNQCDSYDECAGWTYVQEGPSGDRCCYMKTKVEPSMLAPCKKGDICATYAKTDRLVYNVNTQTTPWELLGVWIGDEKFLGYENRTQTDPYCTQIMGQPTTRPGRRIFSWFGSRDYCVDNHIDPVMGEFTCDDEGGSSWFKDTLLYGYGEIYMEQVIGWRCLAPSYCQDTLRDSYGSETVMPDDWNLTKSSCVEFLTWDLTRAPGLYTCYKMQHSLIEGPNGEQLLVNTITYGNGAEEPWADCPSAATWDPETLAADPLAGGSARVHFQSTYSNYVYDYEYDYGTPQINAYDPCTWSCYAVSEGECCKDETGFPYTCGTKPAPEE